MNIGDRIRIERKKRGLSQTDLAKAISVSKQTLYKYENNIITNIPSDKIERLSAILDVAPSYIMGWDEASSPEEALQHMVSSESDEPAGSASAHPLEKPRLLLNKKEEAHIIRYRKLDSHGQELVDTILDKEYDRCTVAAAGNIASLPLSDKLYLTPQAAHERTDITVTDEMRKHDDDIMDDDNFWK